MLQAQDVSLTAGSDMRFFHDSSPVGMLQLLTCSADRFRLYLNKGR